MERAPQHAQQRPRSSAIGSRRSSSLIGHRWWWSTPMLPGHRTGEVGAQRPEGGQGCEKVGGERLVALGLEGDPATGFAGLGRSEVTPAGVRPVELRCLTYLPFDGGYLYLATVIDCYSRRLVGWSIAEHMRTDLVSDALRAAAQQRSSLRGAVFHSDHGAIRREELRPALPRARRGPLDGRCRHQRRQRPGRVVQRCPQAGDPARRRALGHRPAGPAGGVHLDHPLQHPLQHPPQALLLRPAKPQHLREDQRHRYAA